MPIRTFKCSKNHETEQVLFGAEDQSILHIRCLDCGKRARRIDSYEVAYLGRDFKLAQRSERAIKGGEKPPGIG